MLSVIFDAFNKIAETGAGEKTRIQDVEAAENAAKLILESSVSAETKKSVEERQAQLLGHLDQKSEADPRLKCACFALSLLQETQIVLDNLRLAAEVKADSPSTEDGKKNLRRDIPSVPVDLLSLQHHKIIERITQHIFYHLVLPCVDVETGRYIKVTLARNKFVTGPDLVVVKNEDNKYKLLAASMKALVEIFKHEQIGTKIRAVYLGEVLSGLLQLCFYAPFVKKEPTGTQLFREELQELLKAVDPSHAVKHLLLLKGMCGREQKGWLRKVCDSFLTRRYLMCQGGVSAVVRAGLEIVDSHDWQKCEAVASTVARAETKNIDEFFGCLGPQVVELICHKNIKPEVMRVLGSIIIQLSQRSYTLTHQHIMKHLLEPLITITHSDDSSIVDGTNLTERMELLHRLFITSTVPTSSLATHFTNVLEPICAVAQLPTTHVRKIAQQILVRYLTQQESKEAVRTLLVLSTLETSETMPRVNPNFGIMVDSQGGIEVRRVETKVKMDDFDLHEQLISCITHLLDSLKIKEVVVGFYTQLPQYLDFTVLNEKEKPETWLLTEEDEILQQIEGMRKVNLVTLLLTQLMDQEGLTSAIFHDFDVALTLVERLLKTCEQCCEDESFAKTQKALIMNSVMLVHCYVNERVITKKIESSEWQALKKLLPSLELVEKSIDDKAVLLFTEQLRNMILTHGVSKSLSKDEASKKKEVYEELVDFKEKIREMKSGKFENKEKMAKSKSDTLVQEVSIGVEKESRKSETNKDKKELIDGLDMKDVKKEKLEHKSAYQEALDDICSPLLPTRGHGLLSLGKLIEKKDKEALKNKDEILAIFEHNLQDEDSYLYLNAVQGLAVLCDVFPDKIIPLITKELTDGKRSTEDRMKITEALTQATRRLNTLLPKYKGIFINTLLQGARDPEPLVRASSLSNLGEVCKLLRFSLGSIVFEVFSILSAIVKHDKAPEVRRASILVVTNILRGLGEDAFRVLREVLRDLYRELRLVNAQDPDDVVRLHAQIAIEEIDSIMRNFLLPKLNLSKKIYVMETPERF
ncbi:transport and golgi organization 6 [Oratosquilla oratoria]|uniref:transport and golgi organization 6 n=1 Tax=Oratosquilla oratoria TaxID=337810 RepID=UPI003F778243